MNACALPDDGLRSTNDYVSRAIVTLDPVLDNVFIANGMGARHALAHWKGVGRVINVHTDPIDDARVENRIVIEDAFTVSKDTAVAFLKAASSKIQEFTVGTDWVVISCQAGVNRSSAAFLTWLVVHRHMSLTKAKRLLISKKHLAATRYRFKNRYQSFRKGAKTEHSFSWPTLSGRAAQTLHDAIAEICSRDARRE